MIGRKPKKTGIDEEEEERGGRDLLLSLFAGLVMIIIGMVIVFALIH